MIQHKSMLFEETMILQDQNTHLMISILYHLGIDVLSMALACYQHGNRMHT